MKYRDTEYTVVQGIGRQVWKWSVSFDTGVSVSGQAAIKSEAVEKAERDRPGAGAEKAEARPSEWRNEQHLSRFCFCHEQQTENSDYSPGQLRRCRVR
jgi:hypothetical protein